MGAFAQSLLHMLCTSACTCLSTNPPREEKERNGIKKGRLRGNNRGRGLEKEGELEQVNR